jgi:hypothetical protein
MADMGQNTENFIERRPVLHEAAVLEQVLRRPERFDPCGLYSRPTPSGKSRPAGDTKISGISG